MAYWWTDSPVFPNPQTSVVHMLSRETSLDQYKSIVLFGSMIKDAPKIQIPSKIHSAPSTVRRVKEDQEEKKV